MSSVRVNTSTPRADIDLSELLSNPQTRDVVEILVTSLLGKNLAQTTKTETINCLNIFRAYILEYIETKYNKKLSFQLQNTSQNNNFFSKFEELGEAYYEAYKAFFEDLKIHWQS